MHHILKKVITAYSACKLLLLWTLHKLPLITTWFELFILQLWFPSIIIWIAFFARDIHWVIDRSTKSKKLSSDLEAQEQTLVCSKRYSRTQQSIQQFPSLFCYLSRSSSTHGKDVIRWRRPLRSPPSFLFASETVIPTRAPHSLRSCAFALVSTTWPTVAAVASNNDNWQER